MDETFQKNPELYLPFLEQAFCSALQKAHGAYAVVVLSPLIPQHILAARLSAPLLLGIGIGEYFVASDVPAFLPYTRDVVFLDDREYVVLSAGAYAVKNIFTAEKLEKTVHHIPWDLQGAAKDGYKHFMLKEIMEQPKVLRDCLVGRLQNDRVCLPELDSLPVPGSIRIIACGTSYNAGLWSQYYLEQFAEIPVIVEIALQCARFFRRKGSECLSLYAGRTGNKRRFDKSHAQPNGSASFARSLLRAEEKCRLFPCENAAGRNFERIEGAAGNLGRSVAPHAG